MSKPKTYGEEINIMIDNGNIWESDKTWVFGGQSYHLLEKDTDLYDILIKFNFFPSRNECKRN